MHHVATFHGEHFSSDRDGGDLRVFSHTDDNGMPVTRFVEEGTSGIRSSAAAGTDAISTLSLDELNSLHREHYGRRARAERSPAPLPLPPHNIDDLNRMNADFYRRQNRRSA
jgi:hypothetical protein